MKCCFNCKYYEEEEYDDNLITGYCILYNCYIQEIAGVNPFKENECFQEVEK